MYSGGSCSRIEKTSAGNTPDVEAVTRRYAEEMKMWNQHMDKVKSEERRQSLLHSSGPTRTTVTSDSHNVPECNAIPTPRPPQDTSRKTNVQSSLVLKREVLDLSYNQPPKPSGILRSLLLGGGEGRPAGIGLPLHSRPTAKPLEQEGQRVKGWKENERRGESGMEQAVIAQQIRPEGTEVATTQHQCMDLESPSETQRYCDVVGTIPLHVEQHNNSGLCSTTAETHTSGATVRRSLSNSSVDGVSEESTVSSESGATQTFGATVTTGENGSQGLKMEDDMTAPQVPGIEKQSPSVSDVSTNKNKRTARSLRWLARMFYATNPHLVRLYYQQPHTVNLMWRQWLQKKFPGMEKTFDDFQSNAKIEDSTQKNNVDIPETMQMEDNSRKSINDDGSTGSKNVQHASPGCLQRHDNEKTGVKPERIAMDNTTTNQSASHQPRMRMKRRPGGDSISEEEQPSQTCNAPLQKHKEESKRRLDPSVAHDLFTPLTSGQLNMDRAVALQWQSRRLIGEVQEFFRIRKELEKDYYRYKGVVEKLRRMKINDEGKASEDGVEDSAEASTGLTTSTEPSSSTLNEQHPVHLNMKTTWSRDEAQDTTQCPHRTDGEPVTCSSGSILHVVIRIKTCSE